MRIAQISDLHIGQLGEDTFGVDVRQNFELILQKISTSSIDYIVLSGDLCYQDPHPAIFTFVKMRLDQTGIPYFVIPGNHDDTRMLAQYFGLESLLKQNELFFQQSLDGISVLFLDTAVGHLSDAQKGWLQEEVNKQKQDILIFMHHPPLLAGVPFMDQNHPLRDHEEVRKIFLEAPVNVHVFCGHYHIDKNLRLANLQVSITPSCFFQLDPHFSDFAVDHRRIGFREIEWDGQFLQHRVIWL